jgi:hypothetical protein
VPRNAREVEFNPSRDVKLVMISRPSLWNDDDFIGRSTEPKTS